LACLRILCEENFHQTVNHSHNFIDLINGIQNNERLWYDMRNGIVRFGTCEDHYTLFS